MHPKPFVLSSLAAACLAASGAALAVDEVEPNDQIGTAQRLAVGADGSVTVNAFLGVRDVDLFAFHARKGDVLIVDIDGGAKVGAGSIDTIATILGPAPDHVVLRVNDDSTLRPPDPGSINQRDSYIENFLVQADGIYYVAVTGWPGRVVDGGLPWGLGNNASGTYTLIISGVSPSVQQISIDIKPGGGPVAPINPKAKGVIPVALLSSDAFDARQVDATSLTFGHTGDERSLRRCGKSGEDVNGDGLPDLVCHFENQAAGFEPSDEEAILRGRTVDGTAFEGRGLLKVIPVKRRGD